MDRAEQVLKATENLAQWYRPGQSGNKRGRISIRARAAELVEMLAPDFGKLGPTDTVLLKQAAMMIARSESISSVRHADAAIRLSSESRPLLSQLRRHAPKHSSKDEPTFTDIAAHAQAESEARRAAELAADEVAAPAATPTSGDGKGTVKAKPKPAMALDSAPIKPDPDLDEDIRRVCRGELI
jgi:hypothetical protein